MCVVWYEMWRSSTCAYEEIIHQYRLRIMLTLNYNIQVYFWFHRKCGWATHMQTKVNHQKQMVVSDRRTENGQLMDYCCYFQK